ncbi:MAG: hypothetical protein ACFBZ8_01225 [Opitutales bacterium]
MRLLDTLEALLSEERGALERGDLDALLTQILPRKEPLLKAFLRERGHWAQLRTEDPEIDRRLTNIQRQQIANAEALAALRRTNRTELASTFHGAQKASGVRRAYGTPTHAPVGKHPVFTA